MRALLVLLISLGSACAHLPRLAPLTGDEAKATTTRCRQAFPALPWQATHTIFATLPFGQNGALVGVTAATADRLHAVLLSPEGITLFDASTGAAGVTIHRAVPPFDRPAFAGGLMSDVAHAYLAPTGEPAAIGVGSKGETVCRWSEQANDTIDVVLRADGPRAIRTFHEGHLTREIDLLGAAKDGYFPAVHLHTGRYDLDMRLVDHE